MGTLTQTGGTRSRANSSRTPVDSKEDNIVGGKHAGAMRGQGRGRGGEGGMLLRPRCYYC